MSKNKRSKGNKNNDPSEEETVMPEPLALSAGWNTSSWWQETFGRDNEATKIKDINAKHTGDEQESPSFFNDEEPRIRAVHGLDPCLHKERQKGATDDGPALFVSAPEEYSGCNDTITGIEDEAVEEGENMQPDVTPGAVSISGPHFTQLPQTSERQNTSSYTDSSPAVQLADAQNYVIPNAFLVEEDDHNGSTDMRRKKLYIGAIVTIALVAACAIGAILGLVLWKSEDPEKEKTSTPNTTEPTLHPTTSLPTTLPPTTCTLCWIETGQIIDGATETSRSGTSVTLSANGEILVIGEPGVDSVRVFEWKETSEWAQLGASIDGPIGSNFGFSVAASDDGRTVAIGGPKWGDSLQWTGIVRVYRWVLPHKVWELLLEVQGTIESRYGMYFGYDVALSSSGRTLIAAGPYAAPHVEIWTSLDSDLDKLKEWSLLGDQWDYSGIWPEIVSVSSDGSVVLVASDSYTSVYKLDHQSLGSSIDGSFAVLSKDAKVLAVGTSFTNEIPHDIETIVYKWDETVSDWAAWGGTIPGYPVALALDGTIVAVVTPLAIQVYRNNGDSWMELGDDLPIEEGYVSVSPSIVSGPNGVVLAVGVSSADGQEPSERGSTTVYTFHDPSGVTVPTFPQRSFPVCETGFTSFRFELTTDLFPEDQTWSLQKDGAGDPIMEGGPFTEGLTTSVYETCLLSTECYQLRVMDGFQEGICCLYGEGGYILFLDGVVFATTTSNTDIFYGVYSHWFGNCTF